MVNEAMNLFKEMHCRKIIPDVVTYTTLIDGLCNVGRLADALKVFEDILVKGYNLDVYAYTVMIKAFCNKGFFDEALTMLSIMKDNGCIPDNKTYKTIREIYHMIKTR
jgi:pentatricopeptide repeat domain-containing protein 1